MSYEPKTKINDASVTEFISNVAHEGKQKDAWAILEMMQRITVED